MDNRHPCGATFPESRRWAGKVVRNNRRPYGWVIPFWGARTYGVRLTETSQEGARFRTTWGRALQVCHFLEDGREIHSHSTQGAQRRRIRRELHRDYEARGAEPLHLEATADTFPHPPAHKTRMALKFASLDDATTGEHNTVHENWEFDLKRGLRRTS